MRLTARLLLALYLLALSGCTPLYLPPIPARELPRSERLRLSSASGLTLDGGALVLTVVLTQLPREGWLAVQWFSPDNREVASDALWLTRADVGVSRRLSLPRPPEPGEWRAVLSFEGEFVRQLSYRVP